MKVVTDMHYESMNDPILQSDIEEVAQYPLLEGMRNRSVLITGATGLLGSLLIKAIMCANRIKHYNIKVFALARNKNKAQEVFHDIWDQVNTDIFQLVIRDISEKLAIKNTIDYIIHTANETSSKYFVTNPAETICTTVEGTKNILQFARLKEVKSFIYLSSLEIYGTPPEHLFNIKEQDYGYLDILDVRSSYSESKRMAECLCFSYAKEYNLPVKIARLAQTFGAGVSYDDQRVFAQFARCVLEKKDIELHTSGETTRNYCYTTDALKALITILFRGNCGEAYNVANMKTSISIKDMADFIVRKNPEADIKLTYRIQSENNFGYNPIVKVSLDTKKLNKLGWKAEVNLDDMYKRLIASMYYRYPGK